MIQLRPGWPGGRFQRTVVVRKGKGKSEKIESSRVVAFCLDTPVEVSDAEFEALRGDIGNSLFEVEFDAKNRPRFVESLPKSTSTEPAQE